METMAMNQPSVYQACNPAYTPSVPPSPVQWHPALKQTTHVSLGVRKASPFSPGSFSVTVTNGSNGKVVHLEAQSKSCIVDLKTQLNEKGGPEWNDMNLIFNGKPVKEDQCLRDLGVKAGAVFATYRRCNGG